MEQKAKLIGSILGCIAGFIVAVFLYLMGLDFYHGNISPLTGYERGVFIGVGFAVTLRQVVDMISERIKQYKLNSPF